jgi:hypothetical protein
VETEITTDVRVTTYSFREEGRYLQSSICSNSICSGDSTGITGMAEGVGAAIEAKERLHSSDDAWSLIKPVCRTTDERPTWAVNSERASL